jgi:hypothetical protein
MKNLRRRQFENRSMAAGTVHRWGVYTRQIIRQNKLEEPSRSGGNNSIETGFNPGWATRGGIATQKVGVGSSHPVRLEKLSAYQTRSLVTTSV